MDKTYFITKCQATVKEAWDEDPQRAVCAFFHPLSARAWKKLHQDDRDAVEHGLRVAFGLQIRVGTVDDIFFCYVEIRLKLLSERLSTNFEKSRHLRQLIQDIYAQKPTLAVDLANGRGKDELFSRTYLAARPQRPKRMKFPSPERTIVPTPMDSPSKRTRARFPSPERFIQPTPMDSPSKHTRAETELVTISMTLPMFYRYMRHIGNNTLFHVNLMPAIQLRLTPTQLASMSQKFLKYENSNGATSWWRSAV